MEWKVWGPDGPVGTVQSREQGLYLELLYRGPDTGGFDRLVLVWDGGFRVLGLPCPGDGGRTLRRRIPARQVPGGGLCILTPFLPRRVLPWSPGAAVPLAELPEAAALLRGGRYYLAWPESGA